MLRQDGTYFAYLRKSREDQDAEQNGAEDTLSRHEYALKSLAGYHNLRISRWYREVVSGETIADRPRMQELLEDIGSIRPDGVLVVEVERLSRGNPQDQGRVTDTFKYAGTLIITPSKIYDLKQENDEEWLDFGLMRSRMEYRTIKRRMQSGRLTSAMQGKFIGNTAPFGWVREKLPKEKGFTLSPDPDHAWAMQLIYRLMDTGSSETDYLPVGSSITGHILDNLGVKPPKGERWDAGVIARIARNPANMGMVRIGFRKQQKSMVNGSLKIARPVNHDCILVPARWKGQISEDCFNRVCTRLDTNASSPFFHTAKSPLAGLMKCAICKKTMRRRPKGKKNKANTLQCRTCGCPTVGAYYELVEDCLLTALKQWLGDIKLSIDGDLFKDRQTTLEMKKNQTMLLLKKTENQEKQLSKIHTCFEQDIYDLPTFTERSQKIQEMLNADRSRLKQLTDEIALIQDSAQSIGLPSLFPEHILDSYHRFDDPVYRNILLKLLVDHVDYAKTEKGNRHGDGNDSFELDIYVKI